MESSRLTWTMQQDPFKTNTHPSPMTTTTKSFKQCLLLKKFAGMSRLLLDRCFCLCSVRCQGLRAADCLFFCCPSQARQ